MKPPLIRAPEFAGKPKARIFGAPFDGGCTRMCKVISDMYERPDESSESFFVLRICDHSLVEDAGIIWAISENLEIVLGASETTCQNCVFC